MNTNFYPRLMQAKSASDRMDALCEFIEYWLGPRQPSFGESEEAVNAISLPMPLKKLYRFAGRWPHRDHPGEIKYTVPAFSHQDWLASLDKLEVAEDGRVDFQGENQACWQCSTLAEGDDPPVWCKGDFFREDGEVDGEKPVSQSLSRFLATFILQELALGSKRWIDDETLSARFQSEIANSTPIWLDGPYVYGIPYSFFLWGDVMVSTIMGLTFSANNDAGLAYLEANQSPVTSIGLSFYRTWDLTIHSDGSATLRYGASKIYRDAESPPGTFDFPEQLNRIAATASTQGNYRRDAMVVLRRKGQTSGIGAQYLQDFSLPLSLYRRALECAHEVDDKLKEQFEADWPS